MILILTGPVRSHKTTALFHWVKERSDCGGVLTPDEHDLRILYNVRDKNSIPFQKTVITTPTDISIGKFLFDAESFKQAFQWLDEHLSDPGLNYLILDEIGPLELAGKGWDHWIRTSLTKLENKTLILVVRQSLLNHVIRHYSLDKPTVVEKDYFLPESAESIQNTTNDENVPD